VALDDVFTMSRCWVPVRPFTITRSGHLRSPGRAPRARCPTSATASHATRFDAALT